MPSKVRKRFRREPKTLYLGPWLARLGRTQADLARAVEITPSYASDLVSGKQKSPSFSLLADIADWLGIQVDDLRKPPPDDRTIGAVEALSPAAMRALMSRVKPGR